MVAPRAQYAIDITAWLALAMSCYLVWKGGPEAQLPGCGGDTTCNAVVGGRWGRIGFLPVAAVGVGGYLAVTCTSILAQLNAMQRHRIPLWSLMVTMSFVGAGFIIWLTVLQFVVIEHICFYCMSAHLFGLVTFVLVVRYAPVWKHLSHAYAKLGIPGALVLAVMIGAHAFLAPETTIAEAVKDMELNQPGEAGSVYSEGSIQIGKKPDSRVVRVLDNNLSFDVFQVPFLGRHDAEHVVIELYDYNCPSCRKVYAKVHEFMEIHEGRVAVVPLPVPMESDCNPDVKRTLAEFKNSCIYAKYGMAVRAADATKFPAFHDWMMQGAHAPSVEAARERAEKLVGKEAFEAALQDPQTGKWINDGMNIYRYLKAKSLPKILAGDRVISSAGIARKKLFHSLETALGLPLTE